MARVVIISNFDGRVMNIEDTPEAIAEAERLGWHKETPEELAAYQEREAYTKLGPKVLTAAEGALSNLTMGGFDLYSRAVGSSEDVAKRRHYNPGWSSAGQLTGMGAGVLLAGLPGAAKLPIPGVQAARLEQAASTSVAETMAARGATGLAARAAPTVAAGVVGGTAQGMGVGVTRAALSPEELTAERLAGSIASAGLIGGLEGAVAGLAIHGVLEGAGAVAKAARRPPKGTVDEHPDLLELDAKGLQAAEKAETTRLADEQVAQKATLADEIGKFHEGVRGKTWAGDAAKDVGDTQAGATFTKAANRLRGKAINDPKNFRLKPESALRDLGEMEESLRRITEKGAGLRAKIVAEGGGAEASLIKSQAAIESEASSLAARLENNQEAQLFQFQKKADGGPNWEVLGSLKKEAAQLKKQMADLERPPETPTPTVDKRLVRLEVMEQKYQQIQDLNNRLRAVTEKPSSGRMDAIGVRKLELGQGAKSTTRRVLEGVAGYGTYAVTAPLLGAAAPAAGIVTHALVGGVANKLASRMSRLGAAHGERIASALDSFVAAGAAAKKVLPSGAARILGNIQYAPPQKNAPEDREDSKPRDKAVKHYRAREKELRSLVQAGPDGVFRMSMPARKAIYDRLEGVRILSPIIADRMESVAVRKIEFLANRLPKRPGPSHAWQPNLWQPSSFEIGQFARYASAVEDPAGVAERLASGSITPEDTEALREVYPGTFAGLVMDVAQKLGELRTSLPFAKRLSLSILTGQAVDAAMEPQIIALLQANHESESAGGDQDQAPPPRNGKLSPPEPTDAQRRAG